MTTTPSALERARNNPRVLRALREITRTMFYLAIAMISAAWIVAFPLVFFAGELDPLRVVVYFIIPGVVWLIVWHERRGDAKDAATAPAPC